MLNKVAAILHGNVALFEFGVLNEVFGLDRTGYGGPPFDFRVCAPDPSQPLSIGNGASIVATHGLDAARDVDLVAIPGGSTSGEYPEEILDTLRAVVDNGGRVLTVCSGAFVAGAAGLLDGRRCTCLLYTSPSPRDRG